MNTYALVLAPLILATATLDQEFDPLTSPPSKRSGNFAHDVVKHAQTFTVGLSGRLVRIEIPIRRSGEDTDDLIVELRTVNATTGIPTSTVLASVTVPAASVPALPPFFPAFFPIDFSGRESTDYYAGVQYEIVRGTLSGELHTAVVGRYGLVYRAADVVEHALNAGVTVNGLVTVDMGVVREAAYGASVWRPIVGLDIRIGRYALRLARSNGLNDLGATYRIGLDAVVLQ